MQLINLDTMIPDYEEFRLKGCAIGTFAKHAFVIDYEDKILRVFYAYPLKDFSDLDNFMWGDKPVGDNPRMYVPLKEATIIQNICWMHDLAPRVFEIVKIELNGQKYWGQICEKLEGFVDGQKQADIIYDKVKALGLEYGFTNAKKDVSCKDIMDNKLVDFNTFFFTEDHLEIVKDKYMELGKYGKTFYHGVEALGISKSPRDNKKRIEWMDLDKLDFKNKSVLDIGCAGGFFCLYSKDKGASKVLGIDYPDFTPSNPILAAKLVANELEFWDIDYKEMDLRKNKPEGVYDYTFFFSMNYHIGIPDWLPEITKELCIVEDNSKDRNAKEKLEKLFSRVEYKGESVDRGEEKGNGLKIYYCYK